MASTNSPRPRPKGLSAIKSNLLKPALTSHYDVFISEPSTPMNSDPGKKKTKSYIYEATEYAKNQAKWKAAVEFCKDHMIEFKIITEEEKLKHQQANGIQ